MLSRLRVRPLLECRVTDFRHIYSLVHRGAFFLPSKRAARRSYRMIGGDCALYTRLLHRVASCHRASHQLEPGFQIGAKIRFPYVFHWHDVFTPCKLSETARDEQSFSSASHRFSSVSPASSRSLFSLSSLKNAL